MSRPAYYPEPDVSELSIAEAEQKYGPALYREPDDLKSHTPVINVALAPFEIEQSHKFPLWDLLKDAPVPKTIQIEVRLKPPNENIVVYNAEYKFDRYRRRKVENQDTKLNASQFILSLGDSLTFGEGVTTGHDYPSQLAKKLSADYFIYNYGKPGFGPNDLLFRLQTNLESFKDVKQNEGIVIWNFIRAQIDRAAYGFPSYMNSNNYYISNKPRYELILNKPVYLGKFSETVPFSQKLLQLLKNSETMKFVTDYLEVKYNVNEYKIFVALLKEIKIILEQSKNLKKFYLLNLYGSYRDPILFELLQEAGIEVIDFTFVPKIDNKSRIPYEGHPNAAHYWFLTEMLKKTIASP